jgi:uncharacterized membrane protein
MNATVSEGSVRAPWHLWVVGILSLCWNAFGAYDYVMSVSLNADYLKNYPPEMAGIIKSFPVWATSAWALGVWASLVGAALLVMRSRHAAMAFLISLIGAVVTFVYDFTLKLPPALDTTVNKVIPLVIVILVVAQWYYARRMTEAGVLR